MSNMPPGYSDDGDAINHMRDSALYQELLEIKLKYEGYLRRNESELIGLDHMNDADTLLIAFDKLLSDIGQPL